MLSDEAEAELQGILERVDAPPELKTRAAIVLLRAKGLPRREIAALTRTSLPTVDRWLERYAFGGAASLLTATPHRVRRQRSAW
ncbi:helix-turn-helix domain-containing protein [Actinoplanes sp. CA-030573]|uniref:helix-turn-helix domain-containing protein n=1 Tax=Actinoplanes sp. CA-030573 TaxID=3239898 RepID=UPI003D8E32A8